jgi:general secretion pathway protein B
VPAAKPPVAGRPAPAAPVLPTVWDLPYSIRKDIPELALTMHVYADQAADRFVVIKGERQVEGDDLGDGVMLREITPDGMVLEFKGQRFIYPRAGR